MSPAHRLMIFSYASQKFSNRLIQDFLIFKKQKHRQEKQRLKLDWKKFVAEQWPCNIVRNCRILLSYYFNRYRHWMCRYLAVALISGMMTGKPLPHGWQGKMVLHHLLKHPVQKMFFFIFMRLHKEENLYL